MPGHIALLGDSVFDNKAYVGREPDVVEHLRQLLPAWRATLVAMDGSTTADLERQLLRVPRDASHLVISIGGNDALMNSDLLNKAVRSTSETLKLFSGRLREFQRRYGSAIDGALELGKLTTVCTIYEGNLEPEEARIARVALMTFNDIILRAAFARRVPVIDLRFICTEAADYANPIEPSGSGGRKIAEAIAFACGAIKAPAPVPVHVGRRSGE
jgi:GDSL-like Lipase/Acylhydrolase family